MRLNNTLYIVRGLAGSGKSTLAKHIWMSDNCNAVMIAADDYFTDPKTKVYKFDRAKLTEAHNECLRKTHEAMVTMASTVVVHNTFSTKWEGEPYFSAAKIHGYSVFVIECQNDFGSTHDVPEETIANMRDKWCHNDGPNNGTQVFGRGKL